MTAIDVIRAAWPELVPGDILGRGAFGSVYRASNGRKDIAVKVTAIPNDDDQLETVGMTEEESSSFYDEIAKDYENEIRIMRELGKEPNVVSVLDYKRLPKEGGGWYVLYQMELLTPYYTYFSDHDATEEETLRLGIDLCRALEACEKKKVIHRDIKPENIFIAADGSFKLGDFGAARCLDNLTSLYSRHGTASYMAPEVAAMSRYDHRADLYSLGIVLYRQMNKKKLPFWGESRLVSPAERNEALEKRLRGDALPAPEDASDALSDIILKACSKNPDDRYGSASEMRRALERLQTDEFGLGAVNGAASRQKESSGLEKWLYIVIGFVAASLLFLGFELFRPSFGNAGKESEPIIARESAGESETAESGLDESALPESAEESAETEASESTVEEASTEIPALDESQPDNSKAESKTESKNNTSRSESQSSHAESAASTCAHKFNDWIVVERGAKSSKLRRFCSKCGYIEYKTETHTFSAWITLYGDEQYRYCKVCGRAEFKGGVCKHPNLDHVPFETDFVELNRARLATQTYDKTAQSLVSSYYSGEETYCDICGRFIYIPHIFEEPTYHKDLSGATSATYRCVICDARVSIFVSGIEEGKTALGHLQHPVDKSQYTMEGLSEEDAKLFHIVKQCSCGETYFREEHAYTHIGNMVWGKCVLCGYTLAEEDAISYGDYERYMSYW